MKQLLFIAIILCFLSCEKESIEPTSTSNMPKVMINEYGSKKDTLYVTYKGNQIDSVKSKRRIIVYEYQSNVIYEKTYRPGDNIPWLYYKYEYNDLGKIKKMTVNFNVNSSYQAWTGPKIDSYRVEYSYTYDYLEKGIVKESYFNGSQSTNPDYNLLQFDISGNLTVKKSYFYQIDQYIKNKIDSFQYDNKCHYFKNVDIPLYGNWESKMNNVIMQKTKSYSTSWSPSTGHVIMDSTQTEKLFHYEYNTFGYPISKSDKDATLYLKY